MKVGWIARMAITGSELWLYSRHRNKLQVLGWRGRSAVYNVYRRGARIQP